MSIEKYPAVEVFEKEVEKPSLEDSKILLKTFEKCEKKEATHKIICRCAHNLPCKRVKI